MKNKNNIYILGFVFIALLVIAYFVMRDTSGEKKTLKLPEKVFAVDSVSVDKLEIERNGKKIVIEKKGSLWNLTEPVLYTANQQFIGSVLSNLKNYKISSIVSDNPGNKDFFGFNDSNVTKLSVYQGGTLSGQLLIGNAATGPSQTYIKISDSKEVYLAENFLFNNFVKQDLTEWRDKLIISIPKGSIKSIEFNGDKDSYTVTKDTTEKFYVGKDTVDTSVFEGITNMLQNFSTQNFKDTTLAADVKASISAKIDWGKTTEIKFIKYGNEDSKKFLLTVSGIGQVFEVDENYAKMLFKTKKEILGIK